MTIDLTRRTYDLLRLIESQEPVGSVRLVDLMTKRGYSIRGRTIRKTLSDLDEAGYTEKVPGKGRRLTEKGRRELDRGNVDSRLERVRERIATLTSQVTYDPFDDDGDVVTSSVIIPEETLSPALDVLCKLHESPLGPTLISIERPEGEQVRLGFPSSITLDGVLLAHGVAVELKTAGLVEYTTEEGDGNHGGGRVVRFTNVINGEGSTMDVVSLLIEATRTNVTSVLETGEGLLVVDNREVPLERYNEAADLSDALRAKLGGVLDLRRPREPGPFPAGQPGWDFASLTYSGTGEVALSLLAERGLATEWATLYEPTTRKAFAPVPVVRDRVKVAAD